jgi:hypothetical protein
MKILKKTFVPDEPWENEGLLFYVFIFNQLVKTILRWNHSDQTGSKKQQMGAIGIDTVKIELFRGSSGSFTGLPDGIFSNQKSKFG